MFLQASFKNASRSIKTNGFIPSLLKNQTSRLFSTTKTTTSKTSSQSIIQKLGLVIGATSALALHSHSKVLNEAANLGTINVNPPNSFNPSKVIDSGSISHPRTSRFNGNLHYRQLCYGSLVGMFFGVVIGKLSSVLVFITLSSVLTLQFLQSRGIIRVPWTSVVKVGADRVDIRQLVLEDPSFKLSFALSFLIAAFNV